MDSPWGEWQGATVAPPWHLHSRRNEMAGRQGQHDGDIMAQYIWRGEWTEWRLGDWEAAASLEVVSRPLIPFRHVAIFRHPKKGCSLDKR